MNLNRSLSLWLKLLVACALSLTPLCGQALDPAKSVFQYNCQNWTHQTVLPSDAITAVTQTKDGYIWLGTQKGLLRFDGLEFKTFNVNLPQARGQDIKDISKSKEGGFWFAVNGGGFGYFDGQTFSAIDDERFSSSDQNATSIRETKDGSVWTGTELAVGRWAKGKPADASFMEDIGLVMSLGEDSRGRTWVGTVEKGLFYWLNGKQMAFPDESLKKHIIFAVAEDAEGNIWVGTEAGLFCYDTSLKSMEIPDFRDEVKALLLDRHGVLWIGTSGGGLARYAKGEFTNLRKADGLANDNVTSIFEDAEGSIWVGTQDGLSQLTEVKFPLFSSGEGLLPGSIHSVFASKKGGLWITTAHGASYFDGNKSVNYTNTDLLPNLWFKSIYEAKNGDVYMVDGYKTIQVLSGESVIAKYENNVWPMSMAEDAQGLVIGLGPSLVRLIDGKMVPYEFKGEKPVFYYINCVCVAKDGTIWVASNNGLCAVKDGNYKVWSGPEGLLGGKAFWIFADKDGAVWAGTGAGIARVKDGQLKNITPENGLFDGKVFTIIADNQGSFWMDAEKGIFRVTRKALNDFADGKIPAIQSEGFDGLRATKFSGRTDQEMSGCKTIDGRIWFPSPKGVVMIDPTSFYTNKVAPPVYIQQIIVNSAEIKGRKVPVLHPGVGQLEFQFTALSYISPKKVQFRYQLSGFDANWVDAGARRSVQYNNLKPGKYSFQVQACNADGVWSSAGDTFQIEFPSPFYETGWFYGLCGLVGVVALFGAYRWKVAHFENRQRKLQEANELLESNVAKRTDELAGANDALRHEISGHRETEARLKAEIAEREKSDKALAEQRNLLRTLVDNIPDKVFIKDKQSRILLSNLSFAQALLARTPEELVGKTDADFFPPAVAQKFLADEQKLLQSGEIFHAEEKLVYPESNETRWNLTTKVPLRNSQGEIIGLTGINHDITERKQWESKQEELHKKLVEASRRAGMAEVATGVLHNVGNVLNSVNISATLASQKIRNSKSANLIKIVELIRQHEGDLAHFLTQDEKGKQLPGYLAENLAAHLDTEKQAVLEELQSLSGNIDHIKEIVTMQQANAKLSGVVEIVPVAALVEDALKINVAAFQRHEVSLIRQFEDVPPILVDRHKVLQILVNLLNNAKYACDESGRPDKSVTVRIERTSDDRIQIGVIDNGAGIVPENLTRIFAHGFTTRKNGHGFGLHSGALAAMELGGKLTASSAGRGAGATFILELPVENIAAEVVQN